MKITYNGNECDVPQWAIESAYNNGYAKGYADGKAEKVHGKWENRGGQRRMDLWCSVCNRRASNFVGGYEDWWDLWMPKYCPNCGAEMVGADNG